MAVGDAHQFPAFLTPGIKQLFFKNLLTTFLTYFFRGERQKYGRKKFPNHGSNSQPPGHEPDTLTTESAGQGLDDFVKVTICASHALLKETSDIFAKISSQVNSVPNDKF